VIKPIKHLIPIRYRREDRPLRLLACVWCWQEFSGREAIKRHEDDCPKRLAGLGG
jgi:hypothetical protein